jgi:hypothetical protein
LLQIDVEGSDFEIIRIFDLKKSKPVVIIFENTHLSESDTASCLSHLKDNDHTVKKFGSNTVAMLHPSGNFKRYFTKEK